MCMCLRDLLRMNSITSKDNYRDVRTRPHFVQMWAISRENLKKILVSVHGERGSPTGFVAKMSPSGFRPFSALIAYSIYDNRISLSVSLPPGKKTISCMQSVSDVLNARRRFDSRQRASFPSFLYAVQGDKNQPLPLQYNTTHALLRNNMNRPKTASISGGGFNAGSSWDI